MSVNGARATKTDITTVMPVSCLCFRDRMTLNAATRRRLRRPVKVNGLGIDRIGLDLN